MGRAKGTARGRVKLTITLPRDLVIRAKVYALRNETYIQHVIERALRRELQEASGR